MKRFASILCILVCSVAAHATIYVYSMKDAVQIQRNGQWENLYVGETIQETDWIQTGEFGKVDFYDDKNHNFISVQSSTPKQVKQLINQKKTSSLPQEFWNGIRAALRGHKEVINDLWNTRRGGVSRDSEDWDYQVCRALQNKTNGTSDYAIEFSILDNRTKQPITQVADGQPVIVEVRNSSDTPLFVNIMDVMPNGEKETLVKVDSFDAIMDLYIPAQSTIRFVNYPIAFSPSNTTDSLTLIAYHLPFNLTNVIDLLKDSNQEETDKSSKVHIGQYSTSIHIR